MCNFAVGDRIEKNGNIGTVRFVGLVPPTSGIWVGIEWDDPSRGKHDGSKDGHSYFSCKNSKGGSFARPNVINSGISVDEAVKSRYTMGDAEDYELLNSEEMYLRSSTGLKKVEGVGMLKVQKEFEKLHNLTQIALRFQMISQSGPEGLLSSVIPNIVELDLSKNLLSSWNIVCNIGRELPKLKVLNLSENILDIPESFSEKQTSSFLNLNTLILNRCQLTWEQVLQCSKMWSSICHLHLVGNLITEIKELDTAVFPQLELINLSINPLNSWNDIRKLGLLPKLSSLFVNECKLSNISVTPSEFTTLTHISLSNNQFADLDVFNEINKFPSVSHISFKDNPVLSTEEYHTMSGIIVAKIKQLKMYNRSVITEMERRSAELDYLQKYGLDWKNSGGHQDPELNHPSDEFLKNHPRFMEIVEEYGAPADHQLVKKSTAIKENMIEIMIEAPVKPEFVPIKRRLPLSMTVGNLKLFLQRLTKIDVRKQRLVYVSKDDESYVVDLHRDFETLHDVSIESHDRIQIRDNYNVYERNYARWKKTSKG